MEPGDFSQNFEEGGGASAVGGWIMDHPPGRESGAVRPAGRRAMVGPLMPPPHDDDPKPRSRTPAILGVLFAAVVLVGAPWLFIRSSERRAAASETTPLGSNDELLAGQRVYQRVCVGCHEPRGTGRPRQYPSLVGSPWLLADPETPIRVVLLGMKGPIESGGQRYDNVMPNFGVLLTDREIANVITFCRATWGNKAPAITAEQVARVRASLAGRTDPWNGGAELMDAQKTGGAR